MRKIINTQWRLVGTKKDIEMVEKQIIALSRCEEVAGFFVEVMDD